jgi:predicted enzyme related to lactoylglutathione lyase
LLALGKPPAGRTTAKGLDVSLFVLNTPHVERAKETYRDLFGWAFEQPQDLGPLGVLHPFAWTAGGPRVGAMLDIAGRPGVHPHWLFHVDVAALGPAMNAVRAGGGIVAAELTTPDGDFIAVCDDPQLAAFALRQRA